MVILFDSVLASFGCHHTVFDLQNSKRIYINGNEAKFPATFYKDILSIRITEIFEVLLSIKTWPNTTVLHFPAYKIWLAGYLCDIGLGHLAAQYCESIATSVKSTQKNTPFMHQKFLYTLKELEDRLRVSSSDNGSEKKKAESSSWFGQLKTNFTGQALGKGLETFMAAAVGVDDSSVKSMDSRTSSLYPVHGSDRFEGSNTPISGHIPHLNSMSPLTPGTNNAPPVTHQPYPSVGVKQNQAMNLASVHLRRISETTASDFSSSQFTSNYPMNTQAPFTAFPNAANFSTLKTGNYADNSPGFVQNHNSNALNPVPDIASVSNPMDDLGFGNNSLTVKPAQKSGTPGSEAAQTIEKKPEPVSTAPAEEGFII